MALYDNKYWLLSHIRNSFISTDDTGMCELVMAGENLPKHLVEVLDNYPDSDDSQEEEDMLNESYDIPLDTDFSLRSRPSTSNRSEKMDHARKRIVKIKNIKWENISQELTDTEKEFMFQKKPLILKQPRDVKSLLSEQLEKCTNLPQNPYMEYAKFDGIAQVGIPVRKYKIFLTMLPEEQRNYPMTITCIATAKIHELIGLICLKCSTAHGDFPLKPITNYGLFMTEEDGEVDRDFPCLDAKECVAKFGFTCLGLVELKDVKNVNFETTESEIFNNITEKTTSKADDSKQLTEDMKLMKGHTIAMEALLYKSYTVYIINKMRSKVEIHLGISGEKIEIDPVQQKNSKFAFVRQKAISHVMDSVAWCEIVDTKSSRSAFRIVYSLSFGNTNRDLFSNPDPIHFLQSSASFKHYDFEADHNVSEEIVQKINLILEIRSSLSRKEYLQMKERKMLRRSFQINNK